MTRIRVRNNSPRLTQSAVKISMLGDPTRTGRRDVLLGGRLEVISWKGVSSPDRLLIETADATPGERILAAMTPTGLAPLAVRQLRPEAKVAYCHFDLFNVVSVRNLAARHEVEDLPAYCEPVLPSGEALFGAEPDLILINLRSDGEVGLSLELLHQAYHRLAKGGKLLAAINNPHDKWLAKQLERLFGGLTRAAQDKRALVYLSKKRERAQTPREAAEEREHFLQRIEVPFRGEKAPFETCYGVFSSARLDEGSKALLAELNPPEPCRAILDLGCGWGGLGILAARRCGAERLTMIDANARAVEMARRNVLRLGPLGGETRLEANVESVMQGDGEAGQYDFVVSNPPYGTEFRVTEMFILAAYRALRSGGGAQFVAKSNLKLLARTEEVFGNASETRRWGYQIVTAMR
jgi:16S rRNA (guanine1207-N2)-methyltransferase